ncbi:patatin-like phospholipase domain-containing protein 2 isoform X2 [Orussus abietinus]|uniref:patatin-like phospholipase domain-containing protein 2 isoform X2 n=1 Tax=Orussus abietinus TaxID=222816 RepID=UPI000625B363|nr:patatin-like phospholipase domain-containing protein 2 isoform X2 [Orussus abietinus]
MNLSFAGCGFLGIYHVGVAVCFKKYAPHLLLDKISGASAGAIAACCLLCDLPLGEITSNVLHLAREARQRALGPFSPSFNVQDILLQNLQHFLPADAHLRVNGKLHISLTRVYDGKNVIVSRFTSKEDLLQALLASSFIPLFSGLLPPKYHGVRYMDGGFSDNLPILDENTITINPFCGESDICPRDTSSQLFHVSHDLVLYLRSVVSATIPSASIASFQVNVSNTSIELSRQNIYRFARILFPPNPEMLSNMCKQGFDDALRFLNRNNLINCTRCLAVQSTFVVSETLDDTMEYDPECLECKLHRQEAMVANLPETVMTIFQDAIDSANKGIVNWLFKHKSVKLLSLLSLPYILPADVVYATFTKFVFNAPKLGNGILEMTRYFLKRVSTVFPGVNVYYQPVPQTIKCQVAITEYDSESGDVNGRKQQTNLNLTLQYNDSRQSNCIINMSDMGPVDDTFENILQITADQEALMAYYYMDENNKVQVTEIFDVTDADKHAVLSPAEVETNGRLEFDEWDEPSWLSQHTLTDVPEHASSSQIGIEEMSDASLEDDVGDGSNIFSDPESEWGMEKTELDERESETSPLGDPSDSRPEVDQPSDSNESPRDC